MDRHFTDGHEAAHEANFSAREETESIPPGFQPVEKPAKKKKRNYSSKTMSEMLGRDSRRAHDELLDLLDDPTQPAAVHDTIREFFSL